jgi:hypothetical protein
VGPVGARKHLESEKTLSSPSINKALLKSKRLREKREMEMLLQFEKEQSKKKGKKQLKPIMTKHHDVSNTSSRASRVKQFVVAVDFDRLASTRGNIPLASLRLNSIQRGKVNTHNNNMHHMECFPGPSSTEVDGSTHPQDENKSDETFIQLDRVELVRLFAPLFIDNVCKQCIQILAHR